MQRGHHDIYNTKSKTGTKTELTQELVTPEAVLDIGTHRRHGAQPTAIRSDLKHFACGYFLVFFCFFSHTLNLSPALAHIVQFKFPWLRHK